MGVPISAMQPVTALNPTDNFVISQGPVLGNNKRIEYQDLLALITAAVQNFGQSLVTVQTTNYTNNNLAPDVIPGLSLLLTQGKWDIFFDCSMTGSGVLADIAYYISYNTNPLITGQNASDVTLSGSMRNSRVPAVGSINATSMGASLIVPTGLTYIVKLVTYDAIGTSYTVNNRVIKAIKTL
jgi:hypothetical protein